MVCARRAEMKCGLLCVVVTFLVSVGTLVQSSPLCGNGTWTGPWTYAVSDGLGTCVCTWTNATTHTTPTTLRAHLPNTTSNCSDNCAGAVSLNLALNGTCVAPTLTLNNPCCPATSNITGTLAHAPGGLDTLVLSGFCAEERIYIFAKISRPRRWA